MPVRSEGAYRCLVVDHDDTAVRSTPEIHYPAYCAMLRELRPGTPHLSLAGFFLAVQGGLAAHLREDLGFGPEELLREQEIWRAHVRARVPSFHPGFVEILRDHQARGGILSVVSHSEASIILRDYRENAPGVAVDAVYGWDEGEGRRKPSAFPVLDLLERFGLGREEVLVVDDLAPGVTMARAAGVDVAGAGWAHEVPQIQSYLRRECTFYLECVADLQALLVRGGAAGVDSCEEPGSSFPPGA